MSQDTNVENLIINKLTKAQYESITTPDPTQLYFVTDEIISSSDVIAALGYTPYNASNPAGYTSNVGTVTSVNNIQPDTNGNVTITIPDTATWGNITGTLSNQTDLQAALNSKYDASNPDGFISGITSSDVTSALGFTPENVSNKVTSISSSSTDTQYPSAKLVYDQLAGKQPTLVSGTNIKTVNNNSLLGSGNINIDSLPSQTGQSGKFLTTNGTTASWATVTAPAWGNITGTLSNQTDLQDALDEKVEYAMTITDYTV